MGRIIGLKRWGGLNSKNIGRRIKAKIEKIRVSP